MPTVRYLWLLLLLGCSPPPKPPPHDEPKLRAQCHYGRGDLPSVTLAEQSRLGDQIPIDHFIFVMQENRSFDSYYSSLTVPGETVDGAAADATNPDPTTPGGTVSRHPVSDYCFDTPAEEWADIHADYDDGKMDGFTARNALGHAQDDPTGARALAFYGEAELPFYYALARAFASSDRHFSSVLTNTWPNRLFFMAGSAYGRVDDSTIPHGAAPNLFTRLNDAKLDWKVYSQALPTPILLGDTYGANLAHFVDFETFFSDAAAGQLPAFALVEGNPLLKGIAPDEDPPAGPQLGQQMVERIARAVMASPQWPSSALLITYDEAGGFYDHVPPPAACVPDDIPPDRPEGGAYDRLGLRVPLLAVSPFARRGHVSHQTTDHTSLLRLVAARFGLPALTHRDANAEPPWELFDFEHPDTRVPTLPASPLDQAQVDACAARYPPMTP